MDNVSKTSHLKEKFWDLWKYYKIIQECKNRIQQLNGMDK